jgi:hypothetical protein
MAKLEQIKGVLDAMKVHKTTHPLETPIESKKPASVKTSHLKNPASLGT